MYACGDLQELRQKGRVLKRREGRRHGLDVVEEERTEVT